MDGRVFKCSAFYFSLNSINCIYCYLVHLYPSILFLSSVHLSCFVICLQLPPPRLVYKLFAGGKVMQLVIFQFSIKFVVVVVVVGREGKGRLL